MAALRYDSLLELMPSFQYDALHGEKLKTKALPEKWKPVFG